MSLPLCRLIRIPVFVVYVPGWAPGRTRKISPPPGFDLRTLQLVANRYTDNLSWPTALVEFLKFGKKLWK